MKNIAKLIISIAICELAGAAGSVFTTPAIGTWYAGLAKPSFNPPNWIFGPVWIILFFLMGISLYLVWSRQWVVKNALMPTKRKIWNSVSERFWSGSWQKQNVIAVFAVQLILNVLWSAIFFGLKSPGAAFFELLTLWCAIVYTIVNFYRVSKAAAWLLSPYILWVSFAAILNFALWRMNY